MSKAIDVQNTFSISTSTTTTPKYQEQVVNYCAVIEALSSLVYEIQLAVETATSDEVLELMNIDLYDDRMLNTILVTWNVTALLTQNPMAMQIGNTHYKALDVVPLLQQERTLVGNSSNLTFVQENMASNPRSIKVAASTDVLVENSLIAPIQDKPIGHGSGDNSVPIVSFLTKNFAPQSATPRYLSEGFESKDWKKRYEILGDVKRQGGEAARSGAFGLRIRVTKGEHWGGRILFDHSSHGQVGNFREIWTRYYIRFGPNWRRNDERSGKAGYRARSDEVCTAPCLEMTDSHEFSASRSIKGYSYFHRNVSVANIGSQSYEYSRRDWNGGNREREQWYCVEAHHVLNTPGQNNGVYQNWVDGTLVSDQRDLRQRDSATFDIDSSVLIAYVGGDWVADQNMDVYFDDWAVSDNRIGCQ